MMERISNHSESATSTRRTRGAACPRGFSLVEMLVVAAVIGLLVTLITSVASSAVYSQRRANTLNTMRVLGQAVDAFAAEDPLKLVYDRGERASFGKYPPYQITSPALQYSVAYYVEPNAPVNSANNYLSDRLWNDLSGQKTAKSNWVNFFSDTDSSSTGYETRARVGDNRALYVYLNAFGPKRVVDLPDGIQRPLNPSPSFPDFFNPRGTGTPSSPPVQGTSNLQDVKEVLGYYDAWGVPLDYCLYVKFDIDKRGINNATGDFNGYRISDRRPAFRSQGIDREVWLGQSYPGLKTPKKWVWSTDLPRPYASFTGDPSNPPFTTTNGVLPNPATPNATGWTRLIGVGEDYSYRPIDD